MTTTKAQKKTPATRPQAPEYVRLVNGSSVMAVVGSIAWLPGQGVWVGNDVDSGDTWLFWDLEDDVAISYKRA